MTVSRTPMLQRDPTTVAPSVAYLWIPIDDGTPSCVCCGLHHDPEWLPCGKHAMCGLCIGREHDEDHAEECDSKPPSELFRRMEHDCNGCGERHLDWERCASEMWAIYQRLTGKERQS